MLKILTFHDRPGDRGATGTTVQTLLTELAHDVDQLSPSRLLHLFSGQSRVSVMRSCFAFLVVATVVTGLALAAGVFLADTEANAQDRAAADQGGSASCTCPGSGGGSQRPKFAKLRPPSDGRTLDDGDERAALSSVQHALSLVADQSTYVWHRSNGRLSGLVQPTSTFRNDSGVVCRHIVIMLTTGDKTRKTEGIACRLENGVWNLEG